MNSVWIGSTPLISVKLNKLLANSISRVEDGLTKVVMMNPSSKAITLHENTKIASFEMLDETNEANEPELLAQVLEITYSAETVQVGDNLNDVQIEELRTVLARHAKAFGLNTAVAVGPERIRFVCTTSGSIYDPFY